MKQQVDLKSDEALKYRKNYNEKAAEIEKLRKDKRNMSAMLKRYKAYISDFTKKNTISENLSAISEISLEGSDAHEK